MDVEILLYYLHKIRKMLAYNISGSSGKYTGFYSIRTKGSRAGRLEHGFTRRSFQTMTYTHALLFRLQNVV